MRLLKLGVYYPTYLRQFYADRPGLAGQSYTAQHAALIADRVASSDFWTSALRRLGYDTCDTVANAEPLQRQWAVEQGVPFDDRYLFEITRAQVLAFKPDILLVADYSHFGPAFLRELRQQCPSLRLLLGWCGAPYRDLQTMRAWDVALSCIPEMVDEFRTAGLDAVHVNHAFDPGLLDQLAARSDSPASFTFLGSITKVARFHQERERIIRQLIDHTPLQVWADVGPPRAAPGTADHLRQIARHAVSVARRAYVPERAPQTMGVLGRATKWDRWLHPDRGEVDPAIRRRARSPLFGLPMFQQLRDSDVTLNTHIDASPRSASNMRLFEGTGTGACVLTDRKPNIRELFEPDSEIVTYQNADEAVEKYRYLEAHPVERASIAARGQRRAHSEHTFVQRAAIIDQVIERKLAGRRL